MFKPLVVAAALSALAASATAADGIKIGMMTTLSGPGASLGIDIRDGFNLALKRLDKKLGGLPAEVLIADDAQNPETGKQIAERFLKKDKVDIGTGVVFSNIMQIGRAHV